MIVVVDYGVNNLKSVVRALAAGGHEARLTVDPDEVRRADHVVMPGVGHFGQASRNLESTGLGGAVREAAARGQAVMGICLGLQLFFATSAEAPEAPGLGILPGEIRRFDTTLPVPHVGWARVDPTAAGGRPSGAWPPSSTARRSSSTTCTATTRPRCPRRTCWPRARTGSVFPTIVGRGNVLGAQFHPEKSQRAGIELLDAFARWRP